MHNELVRIANFAWIFTRFWNGVNSNYGFALGEIMEYTGEIKKIKTARIKSILYTGIGIFFFPAYQFISVWWIRQHPVFVFFTDLIFVIVGAVICHQGVKNKTRYRSLFKDTFVKKILDEKLENVAYDWKSGISSREVGNAHLMTKGDLRSEDYLKASYKGIEFEQADLSCTVHYGNSSDCVFRGKIMKILSIPMKVSEIQIYTKNFRHDARYPDENKKNVYY